MSQALKTKLDETTFYSTLGLSSRATSVEIHKSYMKLARELHPDKSKSDLAAELFKLISHAHSILMDKEKKSKYDKGLVSKGLVNYFPKKNCHRYEYTTASHESASNLNEQSTPKRGMAAKHHTPYEQQPYGFGTEESRTAHSHSKVPIFQSFNLKNYQRNQRSSQSKGPETPNKENGKPTSADDFESLRGMENRTDPTKREENVATASKMATPTPKIATNISEEMSHQERKREEGDSEEEKKEEGEEEGGDKNLRSKLHKANLSDPFEMPMGSPFATNRHRHYARKKHEAREQGRRSVSPIKSVPTSATPDLADSWQSLKKLLNRFNVEDVTKKVSATEEGTKKSLLNDTASENLSLKGGLPGKVRKAESQSITLDDLGNSLPIDDDSFDMQKVSDTLDSVPVIKRAKLDHSRENSPEVEMASHSKRTSSKGMRRTSNTAHVAEHLYMPVNQPLPKVYKPDVIALDQYMINSKVIEWELPVMPNFQCNILNKSEMERCKELVKNFNAECNFVKQHLLAILWDRLEADQKLNDRLVKVENTVNWISCKDFDFEIVNKLSELQNRQRIVAQSFANLLKTVYAIGEQRSN